MYLYCVYINAFANSIIYGYDLYNMIFKIRQIIYRHSVCHQPPVKSFGCVPAGGIESFTIKTVSYTGLFISPSGISELNCATTKTDTTERSISIGTESLQVFFL